MHNVINNAGKQQSGIKMATTIFDYRCRWNFGSGIPAGGLELLQGCPRIVASPRRQSTKLSVLRPPSALHLASGQGHPLRPLEWVLRYEGTAVFYAPLAARACIQPMPFQSVRHTPQRRPFNGPDSQGEFPQWPPDHVYSVFILLSWDGDQA